MPYSADDWEWDDEDGERAIPHATQTRKRELLLQPRPPAGWFKFFSYDSRPPVETPHAGAWMLCLASVHQWEAKHGRQGQAHMICRDQHDWRLLVVHPDLKDEADQVVETLNSMLVNCSCGGYECIEPYLQNRAAKVFARRACDAVDPIKLPEILDMMDINPLILDWKQLPIAMRASILKDMGASLGDSSGLRVGAEHWLDVLPPEDTAMFEHLTREMIYSMPSIPAAPAIAKKVEVEERRFALLEAV